MNTKRLPGAYAAAFRQFLIDSTFAVADPEGGARDHAPQTDDRLKKSCKSIAVVVVDSVFRRWQ